MTDETDATDGPWRFNAATGYILSDSVLVAVVGDYRDKELLTFNKHRWDADAMIIATAPEMLGVLKDSEIALRMVTASGILRHSNEVLIPLLSNVQEVIAKAEGRSK